MPCSARRVTPSSTEIPSARLVVSRSPLSRQPVAVQPLGTSCSQRTTSAVSAGPQSQRDRLTKVYRPQMASRNRPRTSRLRWVLAGGAVAVVLAVAAVLALSGHGAGGGRALRGEIAVLVQRVNHFGKTPVDGAPCESFSTPSETGPDEVHQGAELVVLDQTGRQIGSAPLQPGVTRHVLPPNGATTTFDCIFGFDVTVPQVQPGSTVEVALSGMS